MKEPNRERIDVTERIAFNTIVIIFSQTVNRLLLFFFVMITARHLGPDEFGILSFSLAIAFFTGIFTDCGLKQLLVREVSRDTSLAKKYIGNVFSIKIFLSATVLLLVIIAVRYFDYREVSYRVIVLLVLYSLIDTFTQVFYSIYQAHEKLGFQAVAQILNGLILLSGGIYVKYFDLDVVAIAYVYIIASIITFIYGFSINKWKFSPFKIEFDLKFWGSLIKTALPFGLTGTFISIYVWIDSIMLSFMKGNEVVGLYNAAYKLVLVFLIVPIAFNSALFPLLSRYYLDSKNLMNYLFEKHFKYMVLISVPLGASITLLAERIILFLYGKEYIPSVIALQLLVWSVVFIFMRTAFERTLEAANRQIIVTGVFGVCSLLNILLNVLLIPKYSFVGAGVATLITDITVFFLLLLWSYKVGICRINKELFKTVGKIVITTFFLVLIIILIRALNLLSIFLIGMVVYFILTFVVGILDEDDVGILRKVFVYSKAD